MGTVRVTQQLLIDRTLQNLRNQTRQLLRTQDQLATGRRVVNISDDPLAARLGVATRTAIQQNEQFLANINAAQPTIRETDTNLQNLVDIVQRVRELTLQAGNETNTQPDLDSIAVEIDQILEQALDIGNHTTNNRFIFAGTRSTQPAFTATRAPDGTITNVTYEGNDGRINVAVSERLDIQVNEPGSAVFNPAGGVDLFQVLVDVRDDLRAGNQADLQNIRLDELEQAEEQTLATLARVGGRTRRIDAVDENIREINAQLEQTFSEAIDADFAETIVNLNAQENAFQAALSAAGRVIQPSLLDFIR